MRIHSAASILLAVTLSAGTLSGQNPSPQPIDIYSNFVGTWVGSVSYSVTAPQVPDPIRLVITETAAHDAIICDYTYNKKGDPRYGHKIRRITLDPAKERMTSSWGNDDTVYLKTTGLKAFASTGLGSFTAETLAGNEPADPALTHLFKLGKNSFYYDWRQGPRGTPLKLGGTFSFQREISTAGGNAIPEKAHQ